MMNISVRGDGARVVRHSFTGTVHANIAFLDRSRFNRGHEVQISVSHGRTIGVRKVSDASTKNVLALASRHRRGKALAPPKARVRLVTINGNKVTTPTTVPFSAVQDSGKISIHFPAASRPSNQSLKAAS